MRYLYVLNRESYREYPVFEEEKYYEDHIWNIQGGEQMLYLSGERHLFDRGEDITISSGAEATICIPELKSRFYIRGMQVFAEIKKEEYLYRNQKRIVAGNFILHPGDILLLKSIRLEVWERQIAVQGASDLYAMSLPERAPFYRPADFPIYKRSPRLIKRPFAEKILIELPEEKMRQNKKGFLMTVFPAIGMMVVTVSVGLLAGRGIYLVMSAAAAGMTVIFSGIKYMDEKKEFCAKNKKQDDSYVDYLWHKQNKIALAYERELEIYEYQYPAVDELIRMVRGYDSRIYERSCLDEDFLVVSVGNYTGHPDFMITGKEPAWDAGKDALTEMVRDIRKKYSVISKPKIIDLKKAHLGIIGEKEALHQQLRILITQLTFFHSYHDLQIIVVYDKKYEDEFAWMRWLPHIRIQSMNLRGMIYSQRTRDLVLGSLNQILKERAECFKEGKKEAKYLPHYLFLIDEPFWIVDHGIMEYLRMDGNVLGFSIIYTSYIRANLPEYIGSVLMLEHSKSGTLLLEEREYREQKLDLYHAQNIDYEWFARNLSVLEHEQGAASRIPQSVTFFDLYGVRCPEELEIRKRWKKNKSYQSLAVPLGMRSSEEVLVLNLHEKVHGPHGLIAGTTGSGKSELIQSYILSLAVNFHPYEVGFLLIDYKGGGMANMFCELPHHLGTITNLDGSGSMRALISVKSELSRRQRLFRNCHVNHINGYMRLFIEEKVSEPLPHLFIISDEFAELKKEQPDFMKELISIARIGRSLGVHLILATQKPAGIVDEQISSNSRFRLCLKVQNESDSKEILRTSDAAAITLPGRAYLQVGNNEVYELFQSALSGTEYKAAKSEDFMTDERVYVVNELGQGEVINQDLSGGADGCCLCKTQLEAVVEHIREIFDEEKNIEVKKPWLPPLKQMIVSPYVLIDDNEIKGVAAANHDIQCAETPQIIEPADLSVCIGELDIPEMQEQKIWIYDFVKEGNLLYVASAGFGKTVFLTTVLTSLAISYDVDILNFYILDYGNSGCIPLRNLPHTAEYISFDDEERYWKFKKLITEEIAARKRSFAQYASPSPEAYRELSGIPLKYIIIAIDQFDIVKENGIEEEEFFTKLARDGISLGIYTVATTTRVNAIRQATLNTFKNKIACYNFDENETFLAVGRTALKQTDIKGRVLKSGETVYEAQIYTIAPCDDKIMYGKALKTVIQEIGIRYSGKEAPHIPVLPQEFYSTMFKEYSDDGSSYLVGLDIEEVALKGFDRTAGFFVIVGNAGMGKTNILQVIADQAADQGRTYVFDTRSMELYRYRLIPNVLYIEGRKECDQFLEEISKELRSRKQFLKDQLAKYQDTSPKRLIERMPFCTILIDDLDEFTELMKTDLNQVTSLIKEGVTLGMVCVITVHAAKSHGMSEMDRMVKQAANGLVLSGQGVVPIFPVAAMRELPRFGDGLLFRNHVYQRVRLPRYVSRDLVTEV